MASIKDIAKELKLAVSTVSMALNDHPKINSETKKIVIETAKKMNYVKNGIAVDLQRKKTNTILLVVEDASRDYFSRFIEGFQKYIAEYEYDLLISTTYQGNMKTALRFISESRVDGAVVFTKTISDEFLNRYASKSLPIVVVGRKISGENLYSVYGDSIKGAKMITEYLIEQGHERIVFMKGSGTTIGSSSRYKGFKEVLEKVGLLDKHVFIDAKESTFGAGYDTTKKLIKENSDIDAIFYANDDIAFGGMQALEDEGVRVPEDISIAGSNDLPIAKYTKPSLTTTFGNQKLMAFEAVSMLMRALKKETIENSIVRIDTDIVIRESVKRRDR